MNSAGRAGSPWVNGRTGPAPPDGVAPPIFRGVSATSAVVEIRPPARPNGIVSLYRVFSLIHNNHTLVKRTTSCAADPHRNMKNIQRLRIKLKLHSPTHEALSHASVSQKETSHQILTISFFVGFFPLYYLLYYNKGTNKVIVFIAKQEDKMRYTLLPP